MIRTPRRPHLTSAVVFVAALVVVGVPVLAVQHLGTPTSVAEAAPCLPTDPGFPQCLSPTPSTAASGSSSASASASSSASASASASSSASASTSASASASASASRTASPSASASGSASASASASSSASRSATSSPTSSSPTRAALVLSTSTPDIVPNQEGRLHLTGEPNASVQLFCYTRPDTTYQQVRPNGTGSAGQGVSMSSSGSLDFSILPGANTRCVGQYTNDPSSRGNSVSVTVHTVLSLSAYRDGVRVYHFQGTNLPRRAGQLITLYRYAKGPNLDQYCAPTPESDTTAKNDQGCVAVRTATAYTNSTNTWRINRTFTGSGQFYFVVRTSQTLNNGRGHSNQRLTVIH